MLKNLNSKSETLNSKQYRMSPVKYATHFTGRAKIQNLKTIRNYDILYHVKSAPTVWNIWTFDIRICPPWRYVLESVYQAYRPGLGQGFGFRYSSFGFGSGLSGLGCVKWTYGGNLDIIIAYA